MTDAANTRIAELQRAVLPASRSMGQFAFEVPWIPFAVFLANPHAVAEAKPLLRSAPFKVGDQRFLAFFGMKPPTGAGVGGGGGAPSLWVGVCTHDQASVTAYTKAELWSPLDDGDVCGGVAEIGDAVDDLSPASDLAPGKTCGHFWWGLPPDRMAQWKYSAGDGEELFKVLITVRLDVRDTAPRAPAREEDPELWPYAAEVFRPWVQQVVATRVDAAVAPARAAQAAAEAAAAEARRREEPLHRRIAELEQHAAQRVQVESQLREALAGMEHARAESASTELRLRQQQAELERRMEEQHAAAEAEKEEIYLEHKQEMEEAESEHVGQLQDLQQQHKDEVARMQEEWNDLLNDAENRVAKGKAKLRDAERRFEQELKHKENARLAAEAKVSEQQLDIHSRMEREAAASAELQKLQTECDTAGLREQRLEDAYFGLLVTPQIARDPIPGPGREHELRLAQRVRAGHVG